MRYIGALSLGIGLVALVACSSAGDQASPTPGTTPTLTTSSSPMEKLVDSSQLLDDPRELMAAAFAEIATGERVTEIVRKMGESGD